MGIWDTLVGLISNLKFATVIRSYEGGVRFRFGCVHSSLMPGLHWQWPLVDSIETIDVVPQVVDLPNQSIVTEDNKCLALSGVIQYRIVDPILALTAVQDLGAAVQTTTMYAIHNQYSASTVEEARDADTLEETIADVVALTFMRWGVKVDRIGLTDGPSPHRLLRLLTEPGVDVSPE